MATSDVTFLLNKSGRWFWYWKVFRLFHCNKFCMKYIQSNKKFIFLIKIMVLTMLLLPGYDIMWFLCYTIFPHFPCLSEWLQIVVTVDCGVITVQLSKASFTLEIVITVFSNDLLKFLFIFLGGLMFFHCFRHNWSCLVKINCWWNYFFLSFFLFLFFVLQ